MAIKDLRKDITWKYSNLIQKIKMTWLAIFVLKLQKSGLYKFFFN